jgi:hypothetical protein
MQASNDPPGLDGLPEGAFLAAPAPRCYKQRFSNAEFS